MNMRRQDRLITDPKRINQMLNGCKVCRIALADEQGPYIVPLCFGFEYAHPALTLYFHSAKQGRKLSAIAADPQAAFELDNMGSISGGDQPCSFTCEYFSITGAGNARIIDDIEEKQKALMLITEHTSGRHFDFTPAQADTVAIIRLDAQTFSAKEKRL